MSEVEAAIDPKWYREVLGQYPTGVSVITAMLADGPIAMVVGSFTSVSLDPPLVAFLPDRNSSTWAKLGQSSRFCVNILSAEQETVCRKLASRDADKYATMAFQLSPDGSPILDGVVAWIECELESVTEAGDHFIVVGRVRRLEVGEGGLPLLFFQGGYGGFAPASLMASDTHGLVTEQLRIVDLARGEMERIAAAVGGQCVATTRLGDELIVAASAGQAASHGPTVTVGGRLPFIPPLGSTFAAWLPDEQSEQWIGSRADGAQREPFRQALARVRDRGYVAASLKAGGLQSLHAEIELRPGGPAPHARDLGEFVRGLEFDAEDIAAEPSDAIRMISAPIFDAAGAVVLTLSVQGFPAPADAAAAERIVGILVSGTERITARLGGSGG